MRVQPRVDAADVEHVPAPGQAPHHLAAAHLLQAHRTRRALRRAGVKVLVRGRRRQQRADVHLGEPARAAARRRRAGILRTRTAGAPARGHDAKAPSGARGHGGEGARLPDDDGRCEHAGRDDQRPGVRGHSTEDAVAADVVVACARNRPNYID